MPTSMIISGAIDAALSALKLFNEWQKEPAKDDSELAARHKVAMAYMIHVRDMSINTVEGHPV